MQIDFKIVTPERVVLEERADAVTLPASEGEITVLPHHVPLVALLNAGVITLRRGSEEMHIASSGGFVEVLPDSRVVVLADTAERAEELSLLVIEEAKKRAEEALFKARDADDVSQTAALTGLERELARLKAFRRKNGGTHAPHSHSTLSE